jgi:hypothetical protein
MRELIARVLAVLDLYVWNKKPEIEGLTDDQSSAFRLAIEELKNRGLQITQFDEDRIKEAVVNDIPAGWNKE